MKDFKLRSSASHGLWCSSLLPLAMLCNVHKNKDNSFYVVSLVSCWGLLLLTLFGKSFSWKLTCANHLVNLLVSVICSVVLSLWTHYDKFFIFISIYCCGLLFLWLVPTLLTKCPHSFTIGESVIVSQGIVLFTSLCILSFYEEYIHKSETMGKISESSKFIQVLLMGCFCLSALFYTFQELRSTVAAYVAFLSIGASMFLGWIFYLEQNPVYWLFAVSFKTKERVCLMLFWIASTAVTVLFVSFQERKRHSASLTMTRKYFHIVMILVYFPGVLWDPELLYLASVVALSVFLVLEIARLLQLPPIGPIIDNAFQVFLDEKDGGILILTHIYLLIGCSASLWLDPPFNKSLKVSYLSGIIAVGIGDTAAAIIGINYGKHRWKGTKKTIEGTVSAVLAQSIVLILLLFYSQMCSMLNMGLALAAAVMTSLLEAKTSQVDNLVLPLFIMPFLSLVS